MSKSGLLGPWVKRFLLDHLIEERNLSRNTQRSYRDTLALLLPYSAAEQNKPVDRLDVFDLSSDVLRGFLDHLELSRRCSVRTRNQRLAAAHAMARFIAERSPEHIAWCSQIRAVPFKRFTRNELSYMDKPEMDALLAAPDRRTAQGRRDHALLLFLYNSGARVSEAASVLIGDLNVRPNQLGDVQLRGKGRKVRRCPLWPATVDALLALVRNRSPDQPVFLTRLGDAITRHGIHWMLRNHAGDGMLQEKTGRVACVLAQAEKRLHFARCAAFGKHEARSDLAYAHSLMMQLLYLHKTLQSQHPYPLGSECLAAASTGDFSSGESEEF